MKNDRIDFRDKGSLLFTYFPINTFEAISTTL